MLNRTLKTLLVAGFAIGSVGVLTGAASAADADWAIADADWAVALSTTDADWNMAGDMDWG